MKDIKALSKCIVKLDEEYERTHHKHKKKLNRLLRWAINKVEDLKIAVRKAYPLLDSIQVEKVTDEQLTWMETRRRERIGRIVYGG